MKREEAVRIIKECKEKGFKHTFYTLNEYHTALDIAIKALEQQPCEDCISRQAVLNALYALCDTGETLKENPWRDNPHIDAVIETIEELPPVTSQSKHEDIAKAFQLGISFGFIDGLANKTQESEDKR